MAIKYSRIVALFVLFAVTPDSVTANQVLGVPPEDDLGAVQLSTHGTIPNDPSLLRTTVNSIVDEAQLGFGGARVEVAVAPADEIVQSQRNMDTAGTVMTSSDIPRINNSSSGHAGKRIQALHTLYDYMDPEGNGLDIDAELLPLFIGLNLSKAAFGQLAALISSLDKNNDRILSFLEHVNADPADRLKIPDTDKDNKTDDADILKVLGNNWGIQKVLDDIDGEHITPELFAELLTSRYASRNANAPGNSAAELLRFSQPSSNAKFVLVVVVLAICFL